MIGSLLLLVVAGCSGAKEKEAAVASPESTSSAPESTSPATSEATSDSTSPEPAGTTDTPAVQVALVTPDELRQKIAAARGKAVLVDFWATWCVPCQKEYPHTVELSKKHPDDLVVYSVSMDETDGESVAAVKEFLAKHANGKVLAFQSAEGGHEDAFSGFEIRGGALPHYKVFGRDGELVEALGGDVEVTVEPAQIDAAISKAIGE